MLRLQLITEMCIIENPAPLLPAHVPTSVFFLRLIGRTSIFE